MYSLDELKGYSIYPLREILRNLGGVPANLKKPELIAGILEIQSGEKAPSRSNRGRRPSTPVTGDKINYMKDGFPKVAVGEDETAEGEQPSAYQGKGFRRFGDTRAARRRLRFFARQKLRNGRGDRRLRSEKRHSPV